MGPKLRLAMRSRVRNTEDVRGVRPSMCQLAQARFVRGGTVSERSNARFYGNMQNSRERGLPVRWRRRKSTPARKVEDLLPMMPDGED
jgi:hypothetical protein